MSSERISLETREDFRKIQKSVTWSKWIWVAWVGGAVATGASVMFFHGEYIQALGALDVATTAWQFAEGRVQEAYAGRINRRGDAQLARRYGNLAEPLAISEARMTARLERVRRSVTKPFPARRFRRDSKN